MEWKTAAFEPPTERLYRVMYSPCGKPNQRLGMEVCADNMGEALVRFHRLYTIQNPKKARPHVWTIDVVEEKR